MNKENLYAVYITIYYGNKMPPKYPQSQTVPRRYIGSANIENIKNGYHGSVVSKKYKKIWKSEIKKSPHLFKTRMISYHTNDVSARQEERRLQKKYNAVKSPLYINMAYASPTGFFGRPMHGISFSEETRKKMSKNRKGKTYEEIFGEEKAKELKEMRRNQTRHNKGVPFTEEQKKKISDSKKGQRWITDGIDDKKLKKDEEIPHGWSLGRTNGVATSETTSFKNPETVKKIKKRKLERYGDENYNNSKKKSETKKQRVSK